jgi:hypothetical protein
MNILIPYERGAHKRALPLFVTPELESRGHTVVEVNGPHRSHKEIGEYVEACDLLLTSTPWWDYISMWVSAARHYSKPWVYHPEGWDNAHPIITPEDHGHAKNQGWPFIPDRACAHGKAMGRVLTSLRNIPEENIRYTGGPRFDVYGKHYDAIESRDPYTGSRVVEENPDGPVVLVCGSSLWHHGFLLDILCERGYTVIMRNHFTDPVEMYDRYAEKYTNCAVALPESIDYNSPERDHEYDPDVEDLIRYARQLFHADVVVNVAGTPTMEALMLGVPVVNLYKLPEDAPPKEHQKLFAHYGPGAHFVDVKAGETSYLAKTPNDIVSCVEDALSSPNILLEDSNRRAAVWDMLRDVLSIDMMDDIPPHRATNSVVDVVEELL